jgi:hypothetical protein
MVIAYSVQPVIYFLAPKSNLVFFLLINNVPFLRFNLINNIFYFNFYYSIMLCGVSKMYMNYHSVDFFYYSEWMKCMNIIEFLFRYLYMVMKWFKFFLNDYYI